MSTSILLYKSVEETSYVLFLAMIMGKIVKIQIHFAK